MTQPVSMAFAWYRPDEWVRLVEVADDRDALGPTYRDWLTATEKKILALALAGVQVCRVEVDVTELVEWCRQHRVPNTDASRAQFSQELSHRSTGKPASSI